MAIDSDGIQLFRTALKLLLLGFGGFYLWRIALAYHAEGAEKPLNLDWRDPARCAERLGVWLGVKALSAILAAFRWALAVLESASADVGEWFLRQRHTR